MRTFLYAGVIAVAAYAAPAAATTLVYSDFSDTTGLQINGNAATAVDSEGRTVLRVTPSTYDQAGSVFSTDALTFGTDYGFSTSFTFNFNTLLNTGADGIVLVIQPNSNDVGSLGGGIGYQGIANSLGVEFDTWNNGGGDQFNASHVGINLNGSVNSSAIALLPFDLDGAGDLTAWVDYNGNVLEVRLASSNVRPSTALLSYVVDLPAVIGSNSAFVGFTSGTGAAGANHDIISWEFRDAYQPIGGVPEPATWAMMIFGFGLIGGAMRRLKRRGVGHLLAA